VRAPLTVLALALAGCPGPEPAPLLEWEATVDADPRGAFLMAWGAEPGDVWVVGGQPDAGVALRGGPSALVDFALPEGTPLLNWVHGTATDDVWVAGLNGTLLHWDGGAWTDHTQPIEAAFWGVHARSRTDVWAVGGRSAWGGDQAVVYHYDGSAWTPLELPELLADLGNVYKAFHDGTDLWACGFEGAVIRATSADDLRAFPSGYAGDIVTVHGLPGEAPLFVGGRGTGAILELNGDALAVTAQAPAGLSGLHVMADGRAVVAGEGGFAGLYDPATDTLTASPVPTQDVLHGVFVQQDGTVWVVGGNLYTAGEFFEGSVWSALAPEAE
jgi:hypothetical protein